MTAPTPLSAVEVFDMRPYLIRCARAQGADAALAEDLVDGFVAWAVEHDGGPIMTSLKAYARTAIKHALWNHRDLARNRDVALYIRNSEGVERERPLADPRAPLATEAVEARIDAQARLGSVLTGAALSDAQARVVQARHAVGGDLSFAEVAADLGITETQARSHYSNALRRLRYQSIHPGVTTGRAASKGR